MKKQNPALMYGLIGAAVLILVGIGFQIYMLSDLRKTAESGGSFSPIKFITIWLISLLIIIAVFIFCIIKTIKDYRVVNPEYTYRTLVGQGLLCTLIVGLASTAFSLLYAQVIDPGARQEAIDLSLQIIENTSMPEDQKEKIIEQTKNQNQVRQTITSLALMLFFGLVVSLISANVLNKRKNQFPGNPGNLS